MKKIIFVTGNDRKIGEAKLACDEFGIEIIQERLKIDEIQSGDAKEISRHKANSAFSKIKNRWLLPTRIGTFLASTVSRELI